MSDLVAVKLNRHTISGQVTDMDGLYIAGLLLPNYFEIKDQEKGLKTAFEQFSQANAQALESEPDQADQMYEAWGERLLIRLTTNLDIRSGFAQRVTEIFPDVDPNLIHFERWHDKDGNIHEHSRIRLDMDQCMSLVTAITNVLKPDATATAPVQSQLEKTKTTKKAATSPLAEVKRLDEQSELEQLRARVQELEAVKG